MTHRTLINIEFIAQSAICTKLFECIILSIYVHILTPSDLQFAYNADTSTT